jgi:hypothetical protein
MTPEQRTLAAAFLAELWPVCREYHATPDIPIPAPVPVRAPREKCPICGRRYVAERLADHVIRTHPEALDGAA